MNYFQYNITDGEIKNAEGEITAVPSGFIKFNITLSGKSVYYKLMDGKITEVIGEAIQEEAARRRVEEFLSAFLMAPFEAL